MARTADKGHGRQEYRRLISTIAWNDYRDGPDVGQVFERERVRVLKDPTEVEVVYGITSLGRERADARALLGRVRGPWGRENGRHYVTDATLGEDRCRVRKGNGAQVLAALRNAVVHLLQRMKASSKAAATRRFAAHPKETLPLLFTGTPLGNGPGRLRMAGIVQHNRQAVSSNHFALVKGECWPVRSWE